MLSERRTGATLGDMQLRSHLLNTELAFPIIGRAGGCACRKSDSAILVMKAAEDRL
jgi:hypothetical protein